MALTLHGITMSTCTKRVAAALEELEVGNLSVIKVHSEPMQAPSRL
jgi:hypothetical protein